MKKKRSIFGPLLFLPASWFGYFDGFKTRSRQHAVQGDFRPRWTVFQNRDDYITLERLEDGSTVWRTAAFKNLGDGWYFAQKCAFYSARDEARVASCFKSNPGSGLEPLLKSQGAIQERRRQERQRIRENKIISRMASVPALPRNLKSWIHKSVMPAYFFYDYKRGGRDIPGLCSACGREIILSNVKQGREAVCPHCRHELMMKPRSRRGYCMTDRSTCQVIQHIGNGDLVIRIIKVHYTYKNDTPEIEIYENARQFIRQDNDGNVNIECYYYQHNSGILMNWKKGERPAYSKWQYNFEADTYGHVYDKNLPATLKGTPWEYCPITDFYSYFKGPMETAPFLAAYLKHPRLEHLVKAGFHNIVSDLAYRYNQDCMDETQNRTHRILKVAAEDVQFLKGLDIDIPTLKVFQGYAGIKDRQRLLAWQMEHEVKRDILPILDHVTVHKFIKYMDSQYSSRGTPQGGQRHENMQTVVTEYRDYLHMCHKMKYDMKNSFVLYPRDLKTAHDKTARQFEQEKDALIKRDFTAVYKDIAGKLDFEQNGMMIVYPTTPDDLIKEGHALHHCVGSYAERVADHECIILFLRQCSNEDKPYYTIEVRGNKAVQVRGMKNCGMTPEVENFIAAWERCVLRTQLPAA